MCIIDLLTFYLHFSTILLHIVFQNVNKYNPINTCLHVIYYQCAYMFIQINIVGSPSKQCQEVQLIPSFHMFVDFQLLKSVIIRLSGLIHSLIVLLL